MQKANALINAARAFRKARKYGDEFDCLQKLAQGHVTRINYYEVVKRQFEIGYKFHPEAPEAMLRLGRLYLDDGKVDQAIRHFSEAIKLHPDTEAARYAALELSNALLTLAKRGDGEALRSLLSSMLSTQEGKRLAESVRRMMEN